MRSVRRLLVVAATVVALTILVPSASAASPLGEIHIAKTCSPTFPTDPTCTVQISTSGPILVGTVGHYLGPLFGSPLLSSEVLLVTPDGGTATGHCTLSFRTGLGTCTFARGTGSLAGFHANLDVTFHFDTGWTNWDGTYFFAPAH